MITNIFGLSALSSSAAAMYKFNAQLLQKNYGPGIDRPLINAYNNFDDEHLNALNLFEQGDDDIDFAWRRMNDFFDLQLYLDVDVGNPPQ